MPDSSSVLALILGLLPNEHSMAEKLEIFLGALLQLQMVEPTGPELRENLEPRQSR